MEGGCIVHGFKVEPELSKSLKSELKSQANTTHTEGIKKERKKDR